MTVKRMAKIIYFVLLALAVAACEPQSIPTHTLTPTNTPIAAPTSISTPTITSTYTSTPIPTRTPTSTPTTTRTHTPTSTPTMTPTPKSADVRLISDLQISDIRPVVGDMVYATFRVRNYGEQTFAAKKFGVKGRGPGDSIQDFYMDYVPPLAPGEEHTYSSKRKFSEPGEYWFTPHYSPDGAKWRDITWRNGRVSRVDVTVIQDNPPEVRISVEPSTIYQGAAIGIEITASDDFGLQHVRWWSEGTRDDYFDQGGKFYCGGIESYHKSWTRPWTGRDGQFTIYAEARDIAGQTSSSSTSITVLPIATAEFSLLIGGEPLTNKWVQEALGFGIDWAALREEIGEVVLVDFPSEEILAGPTKPAYDLDVARRLLAEADYADLDTVILYDSGDELAIELAREIANYLAAIDIGADRIGVDPANARTNLDNRIADGKNGLLIERRQ